MNRKALVLFAFLLVLYIGPTNLYPSSAPPAIGIQSNNEANMTKDFAPSTDGAVSGSSITSFSETLADDTLFYPDAFYNSSTYLATSDGYYESIYHDYTYTWSDILEEIVATTDTANETAYVWVNFTVDVQVEYFDYQFYVAGEGGLTPDEDSDLLIWNWNSMSWDILNEDVPSGIAAFRNGTTYCYPDYQSGGQISIGVNSTDYDDGAGCEIAIAWIQVYYMTLADSDHYAESFADVSDWATWEGTGIFSDGDRGYVDIAGDSAYDRYYSNAPSFSSGTQHYVEVRISANVSLLQAIIQLYPSDTHGGAGSSVITLGSIPTTGSTGKALFSGSAAIESVAVIAKNTAAARVYIDYLRISPADETGWQHDGSTTEALEEYSNSEFTYYLSTDGDVLNMTSVRNTGGGDTDPNAYWKMYYDMTSTKIDLSVTYYQFLEFRYKATGTQGELYFYGYYGGKSVLQALTADSAWHTTRLNFASGSGTAFAYLRWSTAYTYTDGKTESILLDYVKAYSIADFTLTLNSLETSDYLYVDDSNSLVASSGLDGAGEYIAIYNDYQLNVATSTYNVWNITLSGSYNPAGTDFAFRPYYDATLREFNYDETRGDFASSAELDNFYFYIYEPMIIRAFKFIIDAASPSIVRSSYNPPEPWDNEQITLSAVVTDTVDVYSVVFNAITYPAGFSDVDYSATEGQDNLWSYTFSTLTDGYYVFTITANDGANTNSLTEYAYIEITVRDTDGTLTLQDPLLLEWDDVYLNIWANPNKACTLYVYDNGTAAASGSVPAVGSTVRYPLDNSEGLHDLDFMVTDGTTILWPRNDTYYTVTAKWSDLAVVDFIASGTVQSVLGYSWATPLNGTTVFWQTPLESGNTTSDINGGITISLSSGLYSAGSYNFEVWTAATSDHWIVPFTVQQLGFTTATLTRISSYQAVVSIEEAYYTDQLYDIYVTNGETSPTWSLVADNVLCPTIINLDVRNSNQRDFKVIAVDRMTDGNYIQSSAFSNSYTPGPMPNTEETRGGSGYNPWTDPFNWFMLIGFGALAAGIASTSSKVKKGGDVPNVY